MPNPPPRRRPMGTMEKAEALFKAATDKPAEPAAKASPVPGVRETVSLRLDREVLDFFQDEGPGWQERINTALRKAAGLE
ncbi:MAG: BrnA antitoxin family protein [Devosia sp.]|nr:BrnA antitoxin family protein [Devosia sp.]